MDDENINEQLFLELHYWPALNRFNIAMDSFLRAVRYNNGFLTDDHPSRIALYKAQDEWLSELEAFDFVKKMCR